MQLRRAKFEYREIFNKTIFIKRNTKIVKEKIFVSEIIL